ncbi:ras-related and estrogen-regulated growth inhibitor-like isoform X1 [Osmerus eperlanus]|uniref:ras-related and estrogen-regulated growth inhibitor-like isoform X1 n=2 Tax=Osmerus eperlanus TaxID=29151 RepID=UPI002E150501
MDKETMTTNFGLSKTLRRSGSHPSRTVRIVILGQAAVGKTAMAVRFITKRFIGEYDPTLETIYRHEMCISGDVAQFEILDTAGQEEDALLIEEKIRWGDAFLIVYSVTDRCSFDEVMRLCFLVNHTHASGGRRSGLEARPPPMVIVANKKDLAFDRMVTREEGEGLARGLKLPFWEVSVRDGWEETAAVFQALYADVLQQGDSGPASFRRRGVSKLLEKIPRISSGLPAAPAGIPGPPPRSLGPPGPPSRSFSLSSFRDFLPD